MGIFSKKINSDEFEQLSKKITALVGDVEELKKKFEILTTNYNSLRGLVNRKIGGVEETTQSKDINNGMFLPDNGALK